MKSLLKRLLAVPASASKGRLKKKQTRSSRSQMFFKIRGLKNFLLFTKTPVLESLFDNVAGLMACNVIKKRLQHRCFPVNITKFIRTSFLLNISGGCFWQTSKDKSLYLLSLSLAVNAFTRNY